jgi:EAL domain-containing protein (putative c-di-GMP-specific phosphodiesterase class I)
MVFVDAGALPDEDVIDAVNQIWDEDVHVQTVVCGAFAQRDWPAIRRQLAHRGHVLVLRKPFDDMEVTQLAETLAEKWRLACNERRSVSVLEAKLQERARDRAATMSIDAQLEAASPQPPRTAPQAGGIPESQRVLAEELHDALRSGQLSLHYQPLIEIASRRVVSLEALLRWHHPERGPISPADFIPLAEKSGLIIPIGEFVLRSACQQMMHWEREGIATVPVAVNVSGVQLDRQPIWDLVRQILRETGAQPHQLALELTESAFMQNAHRHRKALQRLREDGVHIQIDDFGTGYSSLSYLKQLPFDTLKIDRSFIRRLGADSTDEAIVGAILSLTRTLGLRAVAEGVETPTQLEVLSRHGCQLAQGFYFCRPLPVRACSDLLSELSGRGSFTDTLRLLVNPCVSARASVSLGKLES